VFEAASNHKYDTSDYMKIDSSFGDEATFSALCSEAGDYGIRLICDGVFNHTGDDSLYFDRYGHYGGNGAFNTQASPYYSWYSFSNWPNEYEAWWGIDTLPQVREDNPEYRSFIFGADGVLRHWMRAGISGWRLDVADELPEAFLRELRATVKGENPEALIIGEVWEDATTKIAYGERRHYFDGRELDAVMNYPFKSGVIDYMRSGNAEQFREVVDSICENYPKPALDCLMNGLGTHDTARILTVLGGEDFPDKDQRANASMSRAVRETAKERLYTASLLQFTLPGVPCIYYGDEAGMEGYEDPLNRRCFPWGGEDKQIQGWYTALSKLRRDTPAFAGGSYRTLTAKNGVFSFMRRKGDSGVAITVNLGGERENIGCMGSVKILLSHRMSILGDQLFLEPGGSAVMVMK
jgi:glycosidase